MNYQDVDMKEEECSLLVDRDGIVLSVNTKFSEVFGSDVTDIVGQPFGMLFHPTILEIVGKDLLNTLSNGETWCGYLKRFMNTGESFWAHFTIRPMKSTGGFVSSCRKALDGEMLLINSLYPDIFLMDEHRMAYIEAVLSYRNKDHSFRVDADNLKELMVKTKKIISNLMDEGGAFEVILFDSNILSIENFIVLVKNNLFDSNTLPMDCFTAMIKNHLSE
jgi:PAS domain S-box-containing protein